MAIDIVKGSHKGFFPSKVAAANGNSAHIYNVVLSANHDNGELIKRNTTWAAFDQFGESSTAVAAADFTGNVLGASQSNPGYWYVQVLTVANDVVVVYNSPVSEYGERDLQDEKLFYNKTGDVVQGISLMRGDILELSANAFSGTVAANAAVTYDKTNKVYAIGS